MPMSNEAICSVCCLGYNHAHFLEQNIRAIWEGEYKQIEIIVVDDGSTDSSVRMLYTTLCSICHLDDVVIRLPKVLIPFGITY